MSGQTSASPSTPRNSFGKAKQMANLLEKDPLLQHSTAVFDDAAMAKVLPDDVFARFRACLVSGEPTPEPDQKVIAAEMFKWARARGAVSFGHWFFPMRGGGGALGGQLGALKMDAFLDLVWSSDSTIKPFEEAFPYDRLFGGETDGSSFPNGGLRVTHQAAAFTTWDRSSPCFVLDGVLRIPCGFVTHYGKCLDDKTPVLRAQDAVNTWGKKLFALLSFPGEEKFAKTSSFTTYLGWEQEFFVVSAEHYRARPDLVNCGRTLMGNKPMKNQQGDLNYFAPVPGAVKELLERTQAVMLGVGCPLNVMHNEVAPGQHECSPIFSACSASADSNVLFMEVAQAEAKKLGLHVLYHEKPFAGINGSGKHANWSAGTDTGLNCFHPGKTEGERELFVVAIACLAHGLLAYNELVRCSIAHAGNDHRLGAQEAPPAIISLYPGVGFEAHVDAVIAGGALLGYDPAKRTAATGARAAMAVPTGVEDRNRTAPFPFCGNRFEFRAVGSSQNCAFPVSVVNTIFAAGIKELVGKCEGGACLRDAVAGLYAGARNVIFTGNGYSAEWPVEAAKRGLPILSTTPLALKEFASQKNKAVFEAMGVYSAEEVDARAEAMYENYVTTLAVEAETFVHMVTTGILPACVKDLAKYASFAIEHDFFVGDRVAVYKSVKTETDKLAALMAARPAALEEDATYLCDVVKPQMSAARAVVDQVEGLLEQGLYPYPSYETLLYSHHT